MKTAQFPINLITQRYNWMVRVKSNIRTVYNQLAVNLEWAVPWVKGLKFGFDGNYNIESQDRADWYENATYYDADGNATFEDPSNISMTRSSYQHNRYDFNVRADYKNTLMKNIMYW